MRYNQIKPINEMRLDEINMSTSSLRKAVSKIPGALAGLEFEMIVPEMEAPDDFGDELVMDDSYDERARSIDQICEFFSHDDENSSTVINKLRDQLVEMYHRWIEAQRTQSWNENISMIVKKKILASEQNQKELKDRAIKMAQEAADKNPEDIDDPADPEIIQYYFLVAVKDYVIDAIDNETTEYHDIKDEWDEEFNDEWGEGSDEYDRNQRVWLSDDDIHYMTHVMDNLDVTNLVWPYYKSAAGELDQLMIIGMSFAQYMGERINVYGGYHKQNYLGSANPDGSTDDSRGGDDEYRVEPDGSLNAGRWERGLEFVSPTQPITKMLEDVDKIISWAGQNKCRTGSNEHTGLHMNVSVPAIRDDPRSLDYVKAALLLGDQRVLSEFDRVGNEYAQSALDIVKQRALNNPDTVAEILKQMRDGLSVRASRTLHSSATDKYTSINNQDGYIEYRGPGGDWLDTFHELIEPTLLRFVVVTDAATDPNKFREEYLKKLYAMLSPKKKKTSIDYFARYVAGELPRSALTSFLKQLRLEREIEKAGGTNWEVYNIHTNRIVHTLEAPDHETAVKRALAWGRSAGLTGDNRANYDIRRVGASPNVASTEQPAPPAQPFVPRHNYEFYNSENQQVLSRNTNITGAEAIAIIDNLESSNGLRPGTVMVRNIQDQRSELAWEPDVGIAGDPRGSKYKLIHVPTGALVGEYTARDESRAWYIVNTWAERQTARNQGFRGQDFRIEQVVEDEPTATAEPELGDYEIYRIDTGESIVKFYDVTEEQAMAKARQQYEIARAHNPSFNVDNYSIRKFN